MKFWTTGIVLAWGALLPALCLAQEPWVATAPSYGPPAVCPPGYGYGYGPPGGADLYQQLVPDSRACYDNDSRRDLLIGEAFSRTYVRLDYLAWRITGGKGTQLGAPVSGGFDVSGNDPNNLLLASDQNGPRDPVPTAAIVPSLPNGLDEMNGLRGLVGIPTQLGSLEVEAFYFQQLNNGVSVLPYNIASTFGTLRPAIGATTLLNNGALSSTNMILYSEGLFAQEKASFFGSEANWIFPAFTPNVPMTVHPILGFRYIAFKDTLRISGTDIPDPTDPTTQMDHMISSIARNNIFGPQVGLRFATTAGRFDFAAEPKFVAGINRLSEGVSTQQIYSPTEADRNDSAGRVRFAPIFDLSLNTKVHLTDNFALYVAYDLMVAGGFSRAYANIDYNSPALASDPPAISLKPELSSFFAHGIAIGGELTFR